MSRNILSPFSHLNGDLRRNGIGRAVSITLILVLAGGSGSPAFARPLAVGLAVVPEQVTRLRRFVPSLGISNPRGTSQAVFANRGMPPNPPPSAAIRPEPPQSMSTREARVARLELNLRGGVTLAPGELVQLAAVPWMAREIRYMAWRPSGGRSIRKQLLLQKKEKQKL